MAVSREKKWYPTILRAICLPVKIRELLNKVDNGHHAVISHPVGFQKNVKIIAEESKIGLLKLNLTK